MTSRLTIDLDALGHNYRVLCRAAPASETAPVVKADGYGLGAGPIARRLWDEGARSFFVARLEEGEALRQEMGVRPATIYVLDGALAGSTARLLAARLTPVLNTPEETQQWRGPPAALHIDTGMNRLGVSEADARDLAATGVNISLIMSHLGDAADLASSRNALQLARFESARALFPDTRASLSASAGVFLDAAFHFDMVRPGISLYGGGPREVPDARFHAVARLEAPILRLRDLAAGERAGYGAMYAAPSPRRLAVLGCGYADGYMRRAHTGGYAWLHGQRAPLAIVTMDLMAIDVTDITGAAVGDIVEILGPHALLDDLAAAAGSVAHECLVRLGARAERVYR